MEKNYQLTFTDFLDHLIREFPSKQLINVKRSYFHRDMGEHDVVGGGIEALRGVYQSIRMAEVWNLDRLGSHHADM